MTEDLTTVVTSATKKVVINRASPTVIIGERINPTGRRELEVALKGGDFELVRRDAIAQVNAGAEILDVNAGVPGADEPSLLTDLIKVVREVTDVPICIDSANAQALAAALETYDGKALVNSVTGEKKRLEAVLPLIKEHNATVIGLCIGDEGIPSTAEGRLAVAAKIIERATKLGIPLEDIIIDPLVLTLGADSSAGSITLETVAQVVEKFGVNITMGASNVSFGLPDRKYINATFIAMAIYVGLSCPITNPLESEITIAIKAADLIAGSDQFGRNWIRAFRQRQKASN